MKCMLLAIAMLHMTVTQITADDARLGSMQLLQGYTHQPMQGIDSLVGTISQPGGLTINDEIGAVIRPGQPRTGGSFSDRPLSLRNSNRIRWYREQTVNGQPVHLAYGTDNCLLVSFPQKGMNLSVRIDNADQMAEALLMLMTYPGSKTAQGGRPSGGLPPAGKQQTGKTIKAGSYVAIESQLIVEGDQVFVAWEVFEVERDFKAVLAKTPQRATTQSIVKYTQQQIREIHQQGDLKGEAILSPAGFEQKEEDVVKVTQATYLFEGNWVQEGRVQRYVAENATRIEPTSPTRFKYRTGISWNPEPE